MTTRHPCPCCGHLTLLTPPGSYDLCPVCRWEDDGGQLRYPLRADGANGISLYDAQRVRRRKGGRRPRADEPLDEGWRPFDPAVDWTDPRLDSDVWPVNGEALYWWRATYWNGDQHALPAPPREESAWDRFAAHVRREVPELEPLLADAVRRRGSATPFDVASAAAELAISSFRAGDLALGDRVVAAVAPGADETSPLFADSCVSVAFLEGEQWQADDLRPFIDTWPGALREEARRQLDFRARGEQEQAEVQEEWTRLWRTATGQPVPLIAEQLRSLRGPGWEHRMRLHVEATSRVMSDRRWLLHHPWDSLLLAWRHRDEQPPWRTLQWLARPRFAG